MATVSFIDATKDEQIARLELLGRKALVELGVEPISMSPLVHAENTTFRVESVQGTFCLRISRPGYQSTANIRSEIAWLVGLRERGFRVPTPWQPRVVNAGAIGVPEPRDCVLFHWIEGIIPRKSISADQARQVGELLAGLHSFVATWQEPPNFERQKVHTWLLDREEPMSIDHPNPMVHEPDRQILHQVATESRKMAADLPRDSSWLGLIHADLHPGNLVFQDGLLHAIDFDDSGYGFLIYDFATFLAVKVGEPDFEEIKQALLDGYESIRPLPVRTHELLPQFLKLRLTSIANWLAGRPDNPEFREGAPKWIGSLCEKIRGIDFGYPI